MPYNQNTAPRPQSPPLNALRAFESAARLGSFTAAAQELGVTPGAIAQHVKSLEAWAETKLFTRNARGITLTALGQELLPRFTQAFDQLGGAVQALRTSATPNKLRIATLPAIAQLWLPEKLGKLRQQLPELTVSVYTYETLPSTMRAPFDITLFFDDKPLISGETALFQDRIFPVCSPQVARGIKTLQDLKTVQLLKDAAWHGDWDLWLRSIDPPMDISPRGPQFSLFSVAIEEAINGAGVLIAHEALVERFLNDGRLIAPFTHQLQLNRKLILKATPETASGRHFKQIRHVLADR